VLQHRVVGKPYRAGYGHVVSARLNVGKLNTGFALNEFHAIETRQKIEMPPFAPELAVGHRLQAEPLLLLYGLADALIFDFLKSPGIDFAFAKIATRILERRRPQQAADLIGSVGCSFCHVSIIDNVALQFKSDSGSDTKESIGFPVGNRWLQVAVIIIMPCSRRSLKAPADVFIRIVVGGRMLDFLEWYFPWSRIDLALKIEIALWFISVGAAIYIYIRTVVLNKPWLPMRFARTDPDESDQA